MSVVQTTGYPSIDRTHLQGIDKSKLNPEIGLLSLFSLFQMINQHNMDEIAIDCDDKSYTRRQLNDDVPILAKGLCLLGLQPRETITIATPNRYEGIALSMAANAVGIRFAYANHLGDPEQLLEQLSHELKFHGSAAVVVCGKDPTFVEELYRRASPFLLHVIDITPPAQYDQPKYDKLDPGVSYIGYEKFKELAAADRFDPAAARIAEYRESDEESFYLQTSGSTSGRPKSLAFNNAAVFAALMYAKNSTGTDTHDKKISKVLCILSYRLPYGWMTIFVNLIGGNRVVLATGATAEDIKHYHEVHASYIYGTPSIFRTYMDVTPHEADQSSLVAFFCSGFAMSEKEYQEGIAYLRAHGCSGEIRNNYGIGEALCVGTASDGVPHRPNTSGKFYVGPTFVIVDENGNEVKYGEQGELLIKSRSLFLGYYGDPVATARAFTMFKGEKYFRTGDYLILDLDGYVTFISRKKRFYQPLGATDKVNCETIERALLEQDDIVKDCAVAIYSPDGKHDASKAFVVVKASYAPSPELRDKLFNLIRRTLYEYQLPDDIVFLEEIPVMESGKINYPLLEKMCN